MRQTMRPTRSVLSAIGIPAAVFAAFALEASVGGQPPQKSSEIPNKPAAASAAQTPYVSGAVTASSQEPSGISWGPGREVQAGLRVRLWAGDKHASRYIFDVYLRNRTKQTLNIKCPSFAGLSVPSDSEYSTEVQSKDLYCSPHLRESSGKRVDIGYQLGTEDRQFMVGPGETVYISHWLLRTMDRHAQKANRTNYTQVAFVEPGTHRMTCDVSAFLASKSKGDQRISLRTGEVTFEVIEADVATE